MERTLIYIPLIHGQSDLPAEIGPTMQRVVNEAKEDDQLIHPSATHLTDPRYGRKLMNSITAALTNKQPDFLRGTKVFLEGVTADLSPHPHPLPFELALLTANRATDILELNDGPNNTLALALLAAGARILATENPDLYASQLRNEVNLAELVEAEMAEDDDLPIDEAFAEIIQNRFYYQQKRDEYIAESINAQLLPQETGILALGAAHNPFPMLDSDIYVAFISRRARKSWKRMQSLMASIPSSPVFY